MTSDCVRVILIAYGLFLTLVREAALSDSVRFLLAGARGHHGAAPAAKQAARAAGGPAHDRRPPEQALPCRPRLAESIRRGGGGAPAVRAARDAASQADDPAAAGAGRARDVAGTGAGRRADLLARAPRRRRAVRGERSAVREGKVGSVTGLPSPPRRARVPETI